MSTLTVSERVNASPARVFELMSDFAGAPSRIKAIKRVEVLTTGPVGKGTRFKETRIMFGREATETMEVTDFQPGRAYTLAAASCGSKYLFTVTVRPALGSGGAQATDLTMTFNATPISFFAKLMSPMFKLMSGTLKKCMTGDLADIKAAAEGA